MVTKQKAKLNEKKIETHVSEFKKKTVVELVKLMKEKNTTLLVSIEGIPSSMFNILKRKLKGFDVQTKVVKKHLIKLALEKVKVDKAEIAQLEDLLKENIAVLFSDKDAYEIASFLGEYKESAKAKPGQIAPTDLVVEAGPTDLPAGPAISELAKVKLKAGIEGGKISIKERAVLTKQGESISKDVCGVLGLLNVTPFTIGFIPLAAYDSQSKKIYKSVKVDKKGILEELKLNASQAIALALHLAYPIKETIKLLIGKAKMQSEKLNSYSVQN